MLPVALVYISGMPAISAQERSRQADSDARPYKLPGAAKSVEVGNFYFNKKDYPGALSRYKEAVATDPHYAPGYLGLGRVYEKIGLKQKALEAYKRYLDELPSLKQAEEAKEVHKAIARLEKESGASTRPARGSPPPHN
jgi:tetratricopeptide (TPR) repeat protein